MGILLSDQRLRAMYPGGRGDRVARRFACLWAGVFSQGLAPRRWVTLEVRGRRSGRTVRFPLGMADWQGHWYLVSMLGEQCNWVCNVRAADGKAALRRRGAIPCQLVEVPPGERAPIIKRYLEKVPGGRPHIPVDRHAPVAEFETVSSRTPVFQVVPPPRPHDAVPKPQTPAQDGRASDDKRRRRRGPWTRTARRTVPKAPLGPTVPRVPLVGRRRNSRRRRWVHRAPTGPSPARAAQGPRQGPCWVLTGAFICSQVIGRALPATGKNANLVAPIRGWSARVIPSSALASPRTTTPSSIVPTLRSCVASAPDRSYLKSDFQEPD